MMPKRGCIRKFNFVLIYDLYFSLIKTYAKNQSILCAIVVLTKCYYLYRKELCNLGCKPIH
jgi:hypothetical protein